MIIWYCIFGKLYNIAFELGMCPILNVYQGSSTISLNDHSPYNIILKLVETVNSNNYFTLSEHIKCESYMLRRHNVGNYPGGSSP